MKNGAGQEVRSEWRWSSIFSLTFENTQPEGVVSQIGDWVGCFAAVMGSGKVVDAAIDHFHRNGRERLVQLFSDFIGQIALGAGDEGDVYRRQLGIDREERFPAAKAVGGFSSAPPSAAEPSGARAATKRLKTRAIAPTRPVGWHGSAHSKPSVCPILTSSLTVPI